MRIPILPATLLSLFVIGTATCHAQGTNDSKWGSVANGLRMRAVSVLAAMSEDNIKMGNVTTKFASRQDLAFAVEIENVTDAPIKFIDTRYGSGYGDHAGKANSKWMSQFLFEIEYFDKDGNKIARPKVEVVDLNSPLDSAQVGEVAAGKTHRFLIRPAEWLRVMDQPVSAGSWSAVIHYFGLRKRAADRIKQYRPDTETLKAWSGNVSSPRVAFTVLPPKNQSQQKSIVWGEPTDGLRAALSYGDETPIHHHGDKPNLTLHIQNVGKHALPLASHMWRNEIPVSVRRVGGSQIKTGATMYSGWTLTCRILLEPQQSIAFDAGNIGLAKTDVQAKNFPHVTHRTLIAPAGSYRMQADVRFGGFKLSDGKGKQLAPLKVDWQGSLKTGKSPLVILDAEAKPPATPQDKEQPDSDQCEADAAMPANNVNGLSGANRGYVLAVAPKPAAVRPQAVTEIKAKVSSGGGGLAGAKVVYSLTDPESDQNSLAAAAAPPIFSKTLTTDKEGRYTISIPKPFQERLNLNVLVTIRRAGYVTRIIGPVPVRDFDERRTGDEERNSLFRSMARSALLNAYIRKGRRVNGRVLLPNGKPADGAKVVVATKYQPYSWKFHSPNDYGGSDTTTTDKDGKFSVLADRRATMRVTLEGQAPLILDNLEKDESEFRFPVAVHPRGNVLTHDGQPIPYAVVRLDRDFPWNEFDMPLRCSRTCAANKDGEFQLPPVPPGAYKFSVRSQVENAEQALELNEVGRTSGNVKAQPLPSIFVIPPIKRELTPTPRVPNVEIRAAKTNSVSVTINEVDDSRKSSRIRIEGILNGEKWTGSLSAVTEGTATVLTAPHGLQQARIETGMAMVKCPGDSKFEIGHAIHIDKVASDLTGYEIRLPEIARIEVRLKLPPELAANRIHVRFRAEYVNEGYAARQPGKRKLFVPHTRQFGNTRFDAPVLPHQDFTLSIRHDDKEEPLYQKVLKLAPGEIRQLNVDLTK